jgi:DNA-binding transcriptional LysR family regulator
MDLRQMRQFVTVAEELHFGKAARRLNMAQPPLSQAIRRLEVDLGVGLFDRSKRAVELTEPGRVFLAEARRTLQQAERARRLVQRAEEGSSEVRVSFIGPALYKVLPGILLQHRTNLPDIEVRLLERASADQIEGVLSGDLDVGFVSAFAQHIAGLAHMVVERAAYLAAVPTSWVAPDQTSIRLAELADRPLIRPPQDLMSKYSESSDMFSSVGITPRVIQEASQSATMLSLVSAGLGGAVTAAGVARTRPPNVRFLKIEDAPPHRPWELMMIWAAEAPTKTAAGFVEAAKAYLAANPDLLDLSDIPALP